VSSPDDRPRDWAGRSVVVAGAGVSGAAAARVLRERRALVTVVDRDEARAEPLRADGFAVLAADVPPPGTSLVVTSPGWRPDAPLLTAAAAAAIEVVGEVELAWRLRPVGAAPWLALTGTNGKTTAVRMLAAVLAAAGRRTVAAGNVGLALLDAVLAPEPYDVIAVELSSFQLHWSSSVRPAAAALLNLAPDHLDWHGSAAAYAQDKAKVWAGPTSIGNGDDRQVRGMLARAPGRQVRFTLREPDSDELGVVGNRLMDMAFDQPGPTELAGLTDLTVPGAHNVANALAAAALARAYGVPPAAVAAGLRAFVPDAHRNQLVATAAGVDWVDDSKATNPHAAAASLAAYDAVVWLAGGLLKGADVDELVRSAASRLRAVVLLGRDRTPYRQALARHAPKIPVVEVDRLDTGAMREAVDSARRLARAGDTVLLAPAAASMDCFRDYGQRGELFAQAARAAAARAVAGTSG